MSNLGNRINSAVTTANDFLSSVERGLEGLCSSPRKIALAGALSIAAATGIATSAGLAPKPAVAEATSATPSNTNGNQEANTQPTPEEVAYKAIFKEAVQDRLDTAKDNHKKLTKAQAEAEVTEQAKRFFHDIEQAKVTAESKVQKEVTPEVKARLEKVGLEETDITPVTDINTVMPGPREAGPNSMNHGKVVGTILEGQAQTHDILNAQNGFTVEDAKVGEQALLNAGMPADVIANLKKGDYAANNVTVFYASLKANQAVFKNIAFNMGDGEIRYDDHRSVGQNDNIGIVTWTNADGSKGSLAARFECSGGELQTFESIEVPQTPVVTPSKPSEPVTPVKPTTPVTTPTTPVFEASTTVCIGLDASGQEITQTFPGHGETQDEAQDNADLAASLAQKDCTPEDTTTTSTSTTTTSTPNTTVITTTTAPTTTTTNPNTTVVTTTTTTQPPKNCTNNPEMCASTTVPPTTPEDTLPTDTQPPATIAGAIGNFFTGGGKNNSVAGLATSGLIMLLTTSAVARTRKKLGLK